MEILSLRQDITHFLLEDIGTGDITTESLFTATDQGEASFIAKDSFITAGLKTVTSEVFKVLIPTVTINCFDDAVLAGPGDIIFTAKGPVKELLKAERVALNLTQRMCGIATLTKSFVDEVRDYKVKITDTRKTTPGLRMIEKYAVRVGGGNNHRCNLADGIMIKDNHIAASGSISQAVNRVRDLAPHTLRIEVEAESLEQVEQCLEARVDIIMLDNMSCPTMIEAVNKIQGQAITEASGGVTLKNVRDIAKTGVDLISIGALTHSAPAVDISMRLKVTN